MTRTYIPRALSLSLFLAAALLTGGCEETPTAESYRREVVISGVLTAGRPVDTIKVSWTGVVDQRYDLSALAIPNAVVVVRELGGTFVDTLVYDASVPGRYHSSDTSKKIMPTRTYELTVRTVTPEARTVTAVTTVPDDFAITTSTLLDGGTLKYDVTAPVHSFAWTPSASYGTYLPTISYLDSGAAMIPKIFFQDTLSSDFQRPDKVGYRIGLPPTQLSTELPWIFLSYYGTVRFDVFAIDANYSDFINQYIPAQGGELREIRYRTVGGIGVFGSRTAARNPITVRLVP